MESKYACEIGHFKLIRDKDIELKVHSRKIVNSKLICEDRESKKMKKIVD